MLEVYIIHWLMVYTVVFVLSESHLTEDARAYILEKFDHPFIKKALQCPFCLGFWISIPVALSNTIIFELPLLYYFSLLSTTPIVCYILHLLIELFEALIISLKDED